MMMIVSNRYPVDELADLRAELRRLQDREDELRAYLLKHPDDRTGVEISPLSASRGANGSMRALADEIGHSLLQRFATFTSCPVVQFNERSGE
jgi:hypothetical protein